MAGEHFEKIGLDLVELDNKQMEKKCNFVAGISQSDSYLETLSRAVGKERASEIMRDIDVQQLFRDEFDQLRDDRRMLREHIMKSKIETTIPMPVNLPRVITNILSEARIKPNSVSDLEPRYFFKEMQTLLDSLCVLPQARLGTHL